VGLNIIDGATSEQKLGNIIIELVANTATRCHGTRFRRIFPTRCHLGRITATETLCGIGAHRDVIAIHIIHVITGINSCHNALLFRLLVLCGGLTDEIFYLALNGYIDHRLLFCMIVLHWPTNGQ
jgi:hypothetical protein